MIHRPRHRIAHPAELLLRWCVLFLAAVVMGCFLFGCATPPRQSRAAVAAPEVKMATLVWEHADTNCTFNVYSAFVPSLSAMQLRANTAERRYIFPATNHHEFFGVKAVRDGLESNWGTAQ